MNTTELLAVFREEVSDQELPYLWSDLLIYKYIDDAQKQFCRDTYGIEDSRSFKITTIVDSEWYKLDARILKLRDVTNLTTLGKDVPLIAIEKMADNGLRFDGSKGPVKALITGMDKGYVRAYPIPNVAEQIELRTFRLPTTVEAGDDFEIDEQHHLPLLDWVKYRAYNVQDAETLDVNKSLKFKGLFEAYCSKAKVEQSRVRRPVSVVTYGGP
jgi:hypothetical protein